MPRGGGWIGLEILAFIVLVVLVIFLIRHLMRSSSGNTSSALDIAKERLAKGEITLEQFEAIKKNIL